MGGRFLTCGRDAVVELVELNAEPLATSESIRMLVVSSAITHRSALVQVRAEQNHPSRSAAPLIRRLNFVVAVVYTRTALSIGRTATMYKCARAHNFTPTGSGSEQD